MPTKKPRIAVTVDANLYATISRMAEIQGVSRGSVVGEFLQAVHVPLMRTVALLEAAKEAPETVLQGLRQTVESVERDLVKTSGAQLAQLDWLIGQVASEAPATSAQRARRAAKKSAAKKGKKGGSNPRIVTRGSGMKNQRLTKPRKKVSRG